MKKRKIFRKGATVTFLSPQKEKSLDPLKIKAFLLAEKEGFEPSRRSTRPTPLAGEPLRPLGYFCMPNTGYIWKKCGGESGIRTHGCFHIAGFQDRCFQPLSHLSVRAKAYSTQTQDIFYHIASRLSMDFCAPGQKSVFHVDNPPCA